MKNTKSWLLPALAVASWCVVSIHCASCPWKENGLLRWSDKSTWDEKEVPGEKAKVTIPTGRRVLLDVQPANLSTLTIENGAALIWDDKDEIVLNTHYIFLKGEFHIGSRTCRFTKRARIRLHGQTDDPFYVKEHEFERKFIGVAPNATLELHGRYKTSWTKLAQTVKPPEQVQCGLIYDHADTAKFHCGLERQNGLHVIVWNEDGSLMDFKVFKEYQDFPDFFPTIPNGKVIGMFAYGPDGIGKRSGTTDIKDLEGPITELGGSLINSTNKAYSYSFLARKGFPGTVKEFTKADGQAKPATVGFLQLLDAKRQVEFQVSRSYAETFHYFRVLNAQVAYPVLTLAEKVVGWQPDDEIVVFSTDFEWRQAETKRIVRCPNCTKNQIKVDDAFKYVHYGNFTQGVDERAEVAMLTRTIVIEGVMEDECYHNNKAEQKLCKRFSMDTFGGHIRIVKGFRSVHIRGVELFHMGQQKRMGAYPLHSHMCENVKGMYWRENSVHHSFSRCFTVHATSYLNITDNVCYKHLGHGLFIEDGVEQFNHIEGNLVAGTMYGSLLMSDMNRDWCQTDYKKWLTECGNADVSSYWITHPNNVFINNVAAGGEGKGFMLSFPDLPLGPSANVPSLNSTHHPKDFPLHFTRNVVHSYGNIGVFMDEKISTGTGIERKGKIPLNGIIRAENEYDPKINGTPAWTEMSFGTCYKNGKENMWIKGGNIKVSFTTLADSPQGFSGGTTLFESGTQVYKCIFIGETDNKGLGQLKLVAPDSSHDDKDKKPYYFDRSFPGQPSNTLTGVGLYQGPNIVKDCFFDKYVTRSWCLSDENSTNCNSSMLVTRHAGAISFKRSNNYPTMTSSYLENNKFGFCDGVGGQNWVYHGSSSVPDWIWKDGNKAVFVRDKDGKLTGTPEVAIVSNEPLFSGPQCVDRPEWGTLQLCPYRYVKLEVLGDTGNLGNKIKNDYPMYIRRDDHPYNTEYSIMGEIRNEYLLQTDRSFLINFNFSHKDSAFPEDYRLFGYGVEKGDVVRVGICQPMGVDRFEIRMDYPVFIRNNATWTKTLEELDEDTTGAAFFHDKKNGILFFKLLSFDTDTNETQRCPAGKCWKASITVHGGTPKKTRTCKAVIPAFEGVNKKTPKKPTTKKCPGVETPEGLGSVNWSNVGYIEHNEFSVTCPKFEENPTRQKPERVGCFLEKYKKEIQDDLIDKETDELFRSMTRSFCLNRCYGRNYLYAAVSRGRRCTCGNFLRFGEHFNSTDDKCSEHCVGDSKQKCGGSSGMTPVSLEVWSTGKPLN